MSQPGHRNESRGASGRSAADVVVLADGTEESARIAAGLRSHGLTVVSCETVGLPERVARLDPLAAIVDLDRPHSGAVLDQLRPPEHTDPGRPAATGARVRLAVLGTTAQRDELAIDDRRGVRLFTRPLELETLVDYLRGGAEDSAVSRSEAPSSMGSSSGGRDSEAPALADFPAVAGLREVESILPELGPSGSSPQAATQLSPEIDALLEASAQQVAAAPPAEAPPPPEAPILVPDEVLIELDELLAPDDEEPATRGMSAPPVDALLRRRPPVPPPTGPANLGDPPPTPPPLAARRGDLAARPSEPPLTGAGEKTNDPGTSAHLHARDSRPPLTATDTPAWPARQGGHPPDSNRHQPEPRGAAAGPQLGGDPVWPTPASAYRPTGDGGVSPPPGRSEQLVVQQHPATTPPPTTGLLSGSELPPVTHAQPHPLSSFGPQPSAPAHDSVQPRGVGSSRYPPMLSTRLPATGAHLRTQPGAATDSIAPHTELGAPWSVSPAVPPAPGAQQGDSLAVIGAAVAGRSSGALRIETAGGERTRRILLRDGDMVNASSSQPAETLLQFLVERGDLNRDVAAQLGARLPPEGRRAAAALIANGHLGQEDLWPVLRAHAEWIIGQAVRDTPASSQLEQQPPEPLRSEPNVFGGATGAEILVEITRRALPAQLALIRLGGEQTRFGVGARAALLSECALSADEIELVHSSAGAGAGQLLPAAGPGFAAVLCALVALGVLSAELGSGRAVPTAAQAFDPLDAAAVRQRVQARLALVREADYFALLGVPADASEYELRRAYLELRRTFEPSRLLGAATADLADDVQLIAEVLDEAYDILRDPHRRHRYRSALEAAP